MVTYENGQTTVEYAVALGFVIAVAILAFATIRPSIQAIFTTIAGRLASVATGV